MIISTNGSLNLSRYDIVENSSTLLCSADELNEKLFKLRNIPIPEGSTRIGGFGWEMIDEESKTLHKVINNYILIRFRHEDKKIPAKSVKEKLRQQIKDTNLKLKTKEIASLKEAIINQMIPTIPVDIKFIDIIIDRKLNEFTVLSNSKNMVSVIENLLTETFHKIRFKPKYSYNDEQANLLSSFNNFITWLIYKIEIKEHPSINKNFSIYINKKITLAHKSTNCRIINADAPQRTVEALNSLANGSKVSEASFHLELNNEKIYNIFSFSLNENSISAVKLKLPKVSYLIESNESFTIIKLDSLRVINEIINDMYNKYLSEIENNENIFIEIKNWFKEIKGDF